MRYEKHFDMLDSIDHDFQEDLEIIKTFNDFNMFKQQKYLIDKTEIDEQDDHGNDIFNYLNIYYFQDIFIITIERHKNYNDDAFIYYHTLRSIKYLSWTEESLCYQIEEHIEKITEKQEIKDKIEKIKLSQKLKNF